MPGSETLHSTHDTIVAIATPPGRGGIGIVRLSGPDAVALAMPLLRMAGSLEPGRARFCDIVDPSTRTPQGDASKLDQAVATYYRAPRSYTGEDVLEIAAHGAPVILEFLLHATLANGARLAGPGEFTERAFLAGRLDLTQAEAVRDLIEAQTLYQARVAASQLDGSLSRRVKPIKTALLAVIAQLEAGIDFAEDDTPTLSTAAIIHALTIILEQLSTLAASFTHGRLVHRGVTLAIVGEPNVGKSSLFNRLVERERAIVTSMPGTTRDLVTDRISLAGIPVEVVDTAGIRRSTPSAPLDEAERIGIGRSHEALAEADLVLVVLEAAQLLEPNDTSAAPALPVTLPGGRPTILALNKSDLLGPPQEGEQTALRKQLLSNVREHFPAAEIVLTSASHGTGISELRQALEQTLGTSAISDQTGTLTSLRQHRAVKAAEEATSNAMLAAKAATPEEMLLLDLYSALRALDELTGQTTTEDILRYIFSTFCIGK